MYTRAITPLTLLALFLSSQIFATPLSPHVAQRVITLSPHATELAFSAGLGDKLVGVSQASDYPPEAKDIEQVANYQGIKLERILVLQPDLVIAWKKNANSRELDQLEKFGIPIYYSSIESLDDIPSNLRQLSLWAEDSSVGKNNATKFESILTQLRSQYHNQAKVRYFYQLSQKPMMSVTDPNWPTDIFQICGGENVLTTTRVAYPQISVEQVIALQPEVIFNSHLATNNDATWQNWPQIPAVKHNFIWSVNPDWLSRPTMRSLKAIKQVCGYFDEARSK
ncbi:helical backbone metal receptor [Vibrio algivorus]|uniref:ABC transporter substrate-binding protein n=1 Tax=Vibrio algivorus TaxID=1667024 RepID=A0A557PDU4_9VIBR|nr:helical backbone metal receptor [Vibrio algivorus]TVO38822.1 ABC transporter substrate-binding protein [Vibrio algivorus]